MPWFTLETEPDRPPMRIFTRSDIDRLTSTRLRAPKRRHRNLSAAKLREIADDYRAGATINMLQERHRVTRREVYRALTEHDVAIRSGGRR